MSGIYQIEKKKTVQAGQPFGANEYMKKQFNNPDSNGSLIISDLIKGRVETIRGLHQ